jgi:hypothetical protein
MWPYLMLKQKQLSRNILMGQSGLRCFVAMAVGRSDINRIYDKHILPTLRAAGIKAVFMGRLEHNDDIDKRIMREIEACDFVIADLHTLAHRSISRRVTLSGKFQ